MRKNYALLVLAGASILFSTTIYAQAPSNDVCANAKVITAANDTTCNPTAGSFANATQENAPDSCIGTSKSPAAFDVWYYFQASATTQIIDVTTPPPAGGGFAGTGAVVMLYNQCGGTVLACGNPRVFKFGQNTFVLSGTTRVIGNGLSIGSNYFVRIYNYGDSLPTAGNDAFTICVHAPPSNDICSNAIALPTVTSTCNPTNGTLSGASQESAPDSCAGRRTSASAYDVWYSFSAVQANQTIEVTAPNVTAAIMLYDACGGSLVTCANPPGGGGGGLRTTKLNASGLITSHTYFVRVYNYGNAVPPNGNFTICVYNTPPPPANDECAGAILITEANSVGQCVATTVSTIGATKSTAPATTCGLNAIDDDVWYKFQATSPEVMAIAGNKSTSIANARIGFTMYHGSCSGTQSKECSAGAVGDSLLFQNLVVGDTYYLRTYTNSTVNTGTYVMCVYKHLAPLNDVCSAAVEVIPTNTDTCVSPMAGTLSGANQEQAPDSCAGRRTSPSANDVWYKFIAKADAEDVEVAAQFQSVVVLYDNNNGVCGNIIDCANPGPGFTQPRITRLKALTLIPGNTYFVRVYAYGNGIPNAPNFNICIYKDSAAVQFLGVSEKNAIASSINIYPNPAKDQLHISFTAISSANVKLVNMNGQLVYTENYGNLNGSYNRTVDMTGIAKGIYMLQITTSSETITRKVVIE